MQKFPLAFLSFAAGLSAQDATPLTRLVDAVAPSIVTVRIVAELTMPPMMGGEKHEMREEALGTVVDRSGLVLVASAALDPGEHMNMMFGGEVELDSTVTSLKVVIGNEDQELAATVVAKDDQLGLSYVRIAELGDRKLVPLAFDQAPELGIGAEVYAVRRLPEGYDYAPFAVRNLVSGRIKKPRSAWILAGGLDTASPLFTIDGKVTGVVARIEAKGQGDDPRGMMMRMLGGGRSGPATFVVGPQVVANSIARALEAAQKAPPAEAK
ncbi:MAG: trypsin-like peptidase domain-containing protein [Planctomycetes bacterium]|nr:trypsin-like peptidase domain-containing protein [Planctomycetota bacterium]